MTEAPHPLTLLALLALLGLAAPCAHAQAEAQPPVAKGLALPPVEAFFQPADVEQVLLSPSGRRLAITSAKGVGKIGLAVHDLDTRKTQRMAQMQGEDIVNVRWVNDDRLIFGAHDRASRNDGASRTALGLFSVQADGGNPRQLVKRTGNRVVNAWTVGLEPLPYNHTVLKVPAVRPAGVDDDDVVIGEWGFGGDGFLRELKPLWLNTRSGRTRSIDLAAPERVKQWMFDSAGQPRLAVVQGDGKTAYHWRAPGQDDWRLLTQHDTLQSPYQPNAVDDQGKLYVTTSQGPDGLRVLSRFDFERNAPAAQPWVRLAGFDFEGQVLTGHDSPVALGLRMQGDAETTVWLSPALQALQKKADARFPGRVNRLDCRRCGSADMVALVLSYADSDPGHYWIYRQASDEWLDVARLRPDINPTQMASVDFQRIRSRDGRDLPLWLTLPATHVPDQALPAVVMVHGGPWVRGGHWRWDAMAQFLASRGYLVISPEFRGSDGYGKAHLQAGFKQWGRTMQDDVADALLWARKQGLADQRACIAGASYGGYATLMGLVRHPELYRCGVAWAAVTDPFLYLEGSAWVEDDIQRDGRRYLLPEMVGDIRTDADALKAVSPVLQAGRIKSPLLLAFGDADLRVPIAHGQRLRSALQAAGQEPEWVVYPGETHGWSLPSTQIDFARRVERFLAQHLGAPPPATPR